MDQETRSSATCGFTLWLSGFAKRVAVGALSATLALSSLAALPRCAEANPLSDRAPVTAMRANEQEVELFIRAGAATPVDGLANTYSFPDLKVTTEPANTRFQSITVQFTTGISANDEIYFNSAHQQNNSEALPSGFVRYSGNKHGNHSVNYTQQGGATADQWQDFLSRYLTVRLADSTNTKGLRIVASLAPVSTTRDYNSLNGHYYEAGPVIASWTQAIEEAEKHSYMGMQGYLVTVTNQAEQDFVFSLVNTDTWIGGTCDDAYTMKTRSWARNYRTNNVDSPTRWSSTNTFRSGAYSDYYWVTGPEAGLMMGQCYNNQNRKHATNPETGETMYMNWASGQPDGPASTSEQWMQLAVHSGGGTGGFWNDLPNQFGNIRYIIEYGGMPDDSDEEGGDAGAEAKVDVYVKVDIVVDPTGRTITTEAEDAVVGQPLDIKENVNGDPEVKTHIMEDAAETGTTPAQVTRTYKIKDPTSPEADAQGWRDLHEDELTDKGEPFHAGSYKVVSTANYREDADGNALMPYVPGEATFTIKPKPIDVTQPASKPDDPTQPDATQGFETADPATGDPLAVAGRCWSKVYDGTPYAAKDQVSLADQLVEGASAWLAFDRAEYASKDAGSCDLVLYSPQIQGPHAADYRLTGLASDGTLTVKGEIVSRPLVVTARWFEDAEANPSTWVRDVAFRDPAHPDAPVAANNDATEFDASAVTQSKADSANHTWPVAWPASMLAPGDRLDQVLGDASYEAQTAGGLRLNVERPQRGTYTLSLSYSGVASVIEGGPLLSQDGNYQVTLVPDTLTVTDRIMVNLTEKDPISIMEPVKPSEPAPKPVAPQDFVKIIEDTFGPDGPSPTGGKLPEMPDGVEPQVIIKKGNQPVDEIDPSKPGDYTVTVTYPSPDGTDYIAHIDYEVKADPTPDEQRQFYQVATRLEGAIEGASITPTKTLAAGSSHKVSWQPGPDSYVVSVEVDGKVLKDAATSWTFEDLAAHHQVTVTLAQNPVLPGGFTYGHYTVTVNSYGQGAQVSPSQTYVPGSDAQASWAAKEGYQISAVWVDGVQLTADQCAAGAASFPSIGANHVVDVYTCKADGTSAQSPDDLKVTTQIKGGPGTITGGATVTQGGSYHVAWEPVIQTTPVVTDPAYAVYEVKSVEVNGAEAAGTADREMQLDNIKENKNVVVTVRPVVYHVNVQSYGPGTASASRTLYKGQGYLDIAGTPQAGARITYIEIGGEVVLDEKAGITPSALKAAGFSAGAFSQVRAAAPQFPAPVKHQRQANGAKLDLGFEGIDQDHVVKVLFAKEGEDPLNDEDVHDSGLIGVTAGVEGGPGSIEVDQPADPGTPPHPGYVDPTKEAPVAWELPDGYRPLELVVGEQRIPLDPDATSTTIPAGLLKEGDHISLVVEKRAADDDKTHPRQQTPPASEKLRIDTSLAGGLGSISAGAQVDRHGSYTVTWSAEPGYRVAKVLVDGIERPDLLEAFSYTFEDVGEHHSVAVELEAVPADPPAEKDPAPSGDDAAPGSSAAKPTDDRLVARQEADSRIMPATGDEASGLPGIMVAGALLLTVGWLTLSRRWQS